MELFSPAFAPFTVSLLVMLAIGAVEVISLLVGFSASGSIDSLLPEVEADVDIDTDMPDAGSHFELAPLSQALGWLSVGRVPILVLLVIFLTAFAVSGYAIQWLSLKALGTALPAALASIPAVVGGAYAMRHVGRWLGRIIPREQSEAASQKEMIGSYATILRGEARKGQPAEAKALDLRGRSHYVLVEPDETGAAYTAGQRVFIIGQDRNIYRAVTGVTPKEKL